METGKVKIFLVDDDALFLKSLEIEFNNNTDFLIETYSTGEACIDYISHNPDVVILDYHLNGVDRNAMNGIETLDKIKKYNKSISVIMLSSQDKIEVAVSCMQHKAFDYVVKSETVIFRLQKIILSILKYRAMEKELNWYMNRM